MLHVGKEFLAAGVDVLLVEDSTGPEQALGTLANVARFHQAVALAHGVVRHGLPAPEVRAFDAPQPGTGMVVTGSQLPRDTDIARLRDWVDAVRGDH